MSFKTWYGIILGYLALLSCSSAATSHDAKVLNIGIPQHQAPFATHIDQNSATGLGIELLQTSLKHRELNFISIEHDKLKDAFAQQSIDIAVGAFSPHHDGEVSFDYSHPYHYDQIGMLTRQQKEDPWTNTIHHLLSSAFIKAIAALVGLIFCFGALLWVFERRKNPEHFGGSPLHGLGAGFWWSAVTMTTVGYGDKSPMSFGGRVIGFIWMFTGLMVISSFTANIAASLTVTHLQGGFERYDQLKTHKIWAPSGSTASELLRRHHCRHSTGSDLEQALEQFRSGKLDLIVADRSLLLHHQQSDQGESVLPAPHSPTLAISYLLPQGSSLLEELNRALLKTLLSPEADHIEMKYVQK